MLSPYLKTSLSQIWVICHLLPFVRVGQSLDLYRRLLVRSVKKVLGKSVGLCKTSKRKDQLYISLLVFQTR